MPRKLTVEMTLEELLKEILYSRAATLADPDAVDLAVMTEHWEALLDALAQKQRLSLRAQIGADALRRVSNGRLDEGCTAFGNELALRHKTGSEQWRLYFRNSTLSRFVRQAFAAQVGAVEGWLGTSGHAVFETHRPAITRLVQAARAALTATDAAAIPLGEWQIARAVFVEDMTRERDGLWAALDERRRERGLSRDWPDLFFRVESSSSGGSEPTPQTPPT